MNESFTVLISARLGECTKYGKGSASIIPSSCRCFEKLLWYGSARRYEIFIGRRYFRTSSRRCCLMTTIRSLYCCCSVLWLLGLSSSFFWCLYEGFCSWKGRSWGQAVHFFVVPCIFEWLAYFWINICFSSHILLKICVVLCCAVLLGCMYFKALHYVLCLYGFCALY